MKKLLLLLLIKLILTVLPNISYAQLYWGGLGGAWNSAGWSTTNLGPYSTAWTNNSNVIFNVDGTITSPTAASNFLSLTCNANVSFTTFTSTIGTNGSVTTIDIAFGKTFDFVRQGFTSSANSGIIKNGGGTLALSGNTYGAGFTLNNGIIVARGVNTFGQSAINSLTINGGVIAGSATISFASNKFMSLIVNSDFAFGSTLAPALSTANLSFASPVNLGANNRVITLNGTGTNTLSGVINSTGAGITAGTGSTGILVLSGANTYTGPTTLSGGTLTLGASEVIPNGSQIILNGGILKTGAFSETYSTLNLLENSTVNLDASIQTHNFLASNLIGWTAGKTLTIIGWSGGYNSTSGTGGKIFFGNNASGLTITQLSQIKFFNGTVNSDALQLLTGEVVPSGTLPITLTSFTGKEANKSIVLNWITSSEKNNKNFEILRSVDGRIFKSIGTVNGAGDSNKELKYSFADASPYGGINYYQLKQIDFDGKNATSPTIAVDSKIAETQITVYAASLKVHIGITSPNETTGKLSLFDIGGRKIIMQNVKLNKGHNSIELNENLNPGVHFVTLENEGKLHHQKFIR